MTDRTVRLPIYSLHSSRKMAFEQRMDIMLTYWHWLEYDSVALGAVRRSSYFPSAQFCAAGMRAICWGIPASITCARVWRKQVDLVRLALLRPLHWRRLTLYRDIRPDLGVFGVEAQPFFESGLGVRLDCIDRAFRLANTAIDAFVRVDDEHILALVETVHGTHLDAVHVFALDAFVVDDVGQLGVLPADCRGQLIHHLRRRDARSLAENGRIEDQRPLARSERRTGDI